MGAPAAGLHTVPGCKRLGRRTRIYRGVVIETIGISHYVHGYDTFPRHFGSLLRAKNFVRRGDS